MYNWCFCNGFVINSSQFDVYEDLMYGFLATGRNHSLILHLVPCLALRSALDPERDLTLDTTLRAHWSWRLAHWRPLVDESRIWVLCPLLASSYRARHTSDWEVAMITEWLTKLLENTAIRTHLMSLLFLEEVDPSSGRPLKL
jgi:hypothetical protein